MGWCSMPAIGLALLATVVAGGSIATGAYFVQNNKLAALHKRPAPSAAKAVMMTPFRIRITSGGGGRCYIVRAANGAVTYMSAQ